MERARIARHKSNQAAQDANAAGEGGQAAAQRVAAKGGAAYRNTGRDLVDSYAEDPAILKKLREDETAGGHSRR